MKYRCGFSRFPASFHIKKHAMKKTLISTLLSLTCMFHLARPIAASAAEGAPPFVEVGKSYTLVVPNNNVLSQYQFKVLELGNGGWVKVATVSNNQVMWLNTHQAVLIAPYPQQTAE
jgi:hypothetical protein